KLVGAPMLLDNNGTATFIYTPPHRRARAKKKARDKMHAAKLFKEALADTTGRWETFHFSSRDNPFVSEEALNDIVADMTRLDYEQEILAIDRDDNPAALWTSEQIESSRLSQVPERFIRIVTALDPSATAHGDEAGIVTAGKGLCKCGPVPEKHYFVLEDASIQASPHSWATAGVASYNKWKADRLVAESNNGGEMVHTTHHEHQGGPPVNLFHARGGKEGKAHPSSGPFAHGERPQIQTH